MWWGSTIRMGTCVSTSAFDQDSTPSCAYQAGSVCDVIEANLADYWLSVGMNPDGDVHISDEISWEYSGGPFFNRVVDAHLSEIDAERYIREVKAEFQRRRAAVTWLIGPSASPGQLGDLLLRHGFSQYEVWKGMSHNLLGLQVPPWSPPGLEVYEVASDDLRQDWSDVVARSYEFPGDARRLLNDTFAARSSDEYPAWHHFLAYMDGLPVAASTLFIKDGVAGIYLVSTVPEERGNGLGSYLTWRALSKARKLDCRLAVLQSTEAAFKMYQKLGFRYQCDINVYRLDAPRPAWKRLALSGVRRVRNSLRLVPRRVRPGEPGNGSQRAETQPGPP